MKYVRNEWDRAGAWLCVIAGAIALIIGYFGVSGTLETGKQLPYVVSGGLVGLFLLGLGAMLWVSADLRDEWRKLDAIDRHLADGGGIPKPAPQGAALSATDGGVVPATDGGGVPPREVSLR